MNIGIDLDGVVYQTERMWRDYSDKYNKLIGGKLKDNSESRVEKRYEWTNEQYESFIKNSSTEILLKAPIYPKAKEGIAKLKENNKIYFITRRGLFPFCKDEIKITLDRLKSDGIVYDDIFFAQDSKVKACKDNNIDIMIDDYYQVVDELMANGVKCLQFRDPLCKINSFNAPEVNSWEEVVVYFDNLNKK